MTYEEAQGPERLSDRCRTPSSFVAQLDFNVGQAAFLTYLDFF